jgi:hypothetical protein
MLLRRQIRKHPQAPISVGMLFIALGAFSILFLHPGPHLSPALADGLSGLCYGLGIGCMLVGLVANRRWRQEADGGPHA